MIPSRSLGRLPAIVAALFALLLLEASRAACGSPFSPARLLERAFFAGAVLVAARLARPSRLPDGRWSCPAAGLALAGAGVAAAVRAAFSESVAAAWVALAAFFALTLAAARVPARSRSRAARGGVLLLLAGAAGALPMAAVEVESRFAHEEIFVVLEGLLLGGVWLALRAAGNSLPADRTDRPRGSVRVHPGAMGLLALVLAAGGIAAAAVSYQRSFSSDPPPSFPGISAESPFLCGEGRPDPQAFDGRAVFAELLSLVEANPHKTAPEEGMLALSTGDPQRAAAFRSDLLRELAAGEFSRRRETKHWQRDAALRAYYYPRVLAAFPRLFAPEEQRRVAAWFADINRRALSRSFDDLIYALAFAKFPEGPYENQENGAGLLALLEAGGLAAPELSEKNRRFLDHGRRGWEARFRNSDDSYAYQPEWIDNAFFLRLRSGRAPREAVLRSFLWLLLQAEPDGGQPAYNAGLPPRLPATAYLGAALLDDPSLLWLSGRSARDFARRGLTLSAQPGVERAVDREGLSPASGSCLLYGDSGLPNRVGPLAPDKIVLRDGWTAESSYLLVNLRFSGWHRYRATNSVVTVRRGDTLVAEKGGAPFPWLPLERRIFRDKRIPREYTNGLLVPPTGFAAAIARLAGFGGAWAQDPPSFARVERFTTAADADHATTSIAAWRGWSHRRAISFHHDGGPIVVLDEARGPEDRSAAIAWHIEGRPEPEEGRYRLGRAQDAELILLPLDETGGSVQAGADGGPERWDLLYRPARPGALRLASVFLSGRWVGARAQVRSAGAARSLEIAREGEGLSLPLP